MSSPAPISSATHDSDAAAERMTDMPCQRPGTAWQNACSVRSGSATKRSVTAKITPEVPSERKPSPARTAPMPTAEAALSPAPPATVMRRPASPQAVARSAVSSAEGCEPSTSDGMYVTSSPVAASNVSSQARAPTFSQSVPEASDISETLAPVRR